MKLHHRMLIALFDLIRPVFGYMNATCIYQLSCSDYAKQQIIDKPFYKAVFLIILRVLSCNPLVGYLTTKK